MKEHRNICWVYDLGLLDYESAMEFQDMLVSAGIASEVPDVIVLLQHPPVFTIGASGGEENITVPKGILAEERIPVIYTDRGGNITYHGPGQLVGYLIFDLRSRGRDVHQWVHNLEEVIIRMLHELSIPAHRDKYPGVWVQQKKICSLGIRVTHWVTKHGFALNINNDLKYFSYIYPCGIPDREVTSMSQLLGHEIMIENVIPCLLKYLSQVFQVNPIRVRGRNL